ncbi:hypothetical protein [Muriicola sp.]|uniref:hypothetical protein n=1 Tax=Muriicola sp. TaxID=2020856 RepID=UPI003C78E404
MYKRFYLLVFTLGILSGCDPLSETYLWETTTSTTSATFYSADFKEDQKRPEFALVELDSLQNYGQLLRKMQQLSCDNKFTGIQFTDMDTLYGITGFTECPNDGIISCYLNRNIIKIKNDSLMNFGGDQDKLVHINTLEKELQKIIATTFRLQFDKNFINPALIHLFIEDKYPITLTKEVLKEIITQFEKINSEMGADYFTYSILFDGISYMDIPPPTPPVLSNTLEELNVVE